MLLLALSLVRAVAGKRRSPASSVDRTASTILSAKNGEDADASHQEGNLGASAMDTMGQHRVVMESKGRGCFWCYWKTHYISGYASGHSKKYYLTDALAKCLSMRTCGGVTCAPHTAQLTPDDQGSQPGCTVS